jgi:hypothetical protein
MVILARYVVLTAFVLSIAMSAQAAPVAKSPVTLSISTTVPRPRSQSPMTVEINVASRAIELIEGRLELNVYVGQRHVFDYTSPDMVLSEAGQKMRLALPPIRMFQPIDVTAYARFVTERMTYELGEFDLVYTPHWKRSLVVAVSQPNLASQRRDQYSQYTSLVLDRFCPDDRANLELLAIPAIIETSDLPVASAAYAGFDILLLENEGFSRLRAAQLEAIGHWAAAGGAVCVRPNRGLTPAHVDFLNRLAGAPSDRPDYGADATGGLVVASARASDRFVQHRFGLGRVVIAHQPWTEEDVDDLRWIDCVTFLWCFRENQQATIRRLGQWQSAIKTDKFGYPQQHPYAPIPATNEDRLADLLLPETIEGVPLLVTATILALFVVMIAPVDFYLLGRLNCRRYTWILLAALSMAFTWITVRVAEHYIGRSDLTRALVFRDVAEGNRVVKTSRYELLFSATQRKHETRVSNTLLTRVPRFLGKGTGSYQSTGMLDFDPEAVISAEYPEAVLETQDMNAAEKIDQPLYEGHLPGSYSMWQQLRQWSPVVTRQTQLVEDQLDLAFDFDALDARALLSPDGSARFARQLAQIEPLALAFFMTNNGHSVLKSQVEQPADELPENQPAAPKTDGSDWKGSGWAQKEIIDLVLSASARQETGMFAVLAQVAPTGGPDFEDLALLDTSRSEDILLVVIVPRGSDLLVFRRLYVASP